MKRFTLWAVAALLVLVPWHETVRATAPLYTVQNLGSFGGLVPTVTGINASGQVVGYVSNELGMQAVRYSDGLGWQALPGLVDTGFSAATGINAAGDVVGYHINELGEFRGFRFRDGFAVEDIAPLAGGSFTAGFAINAAGVVVGYGDSLAGVVPFRKDPGVPAVALPSLNGGFGLACGINAAGQVAGASQTPSGVQHGMLIQPGDATATEIVSPDGADRLVSLCAIDADGHVGGQAERVGPVENVFPVHAVRYFEGTLLDLDTFGSSQSNVESIAAGLSVGWYTLADSSTRAFAHNDADGSFDLNTRISDASWVLTAAKAVNVDGVVAGEGFFNGAPAVFKLTPVVPDTTAPVITDVTTSPSSPISPADGRLVDVAVTVTASDNSGVAPACSVTSVTGGAAGDSSVTGSLSVRVKAVGDAVYTVNVRCTDAADNSSDAATAVTVVAPPPPPPPPPPTDTKAPVIRFLYAQRTEIKLNNVKWESVRLFVWATDNVDSSPSCSITSITGAPAAAYEITGRLTARLRENRKLGDLDRVYQLHLTCVDDGGNASQATVGIDPTGRTTYSGDHRRWRW
jgi:probable HAF family extracellular repeat protein